MSVVMNIGQSADDIRLRQAIADVVSNTLVVAMTRAGTHGSVFGHWVSVLDEAKAPGEPETPPADERVLRDLIAEGKRVGQILGASEFGALIFRLSGHLENEMLDAMHLRAQLAGMADKASDAIIRTIDARLARLRGQVDPDESHPAEGVVEALGDEIVNAAREALR